MTFAVEVLVNETKCSAMSGQSQLKMMTELSSENQFFRSKAFIFLILVPVVMLLGVMSKRLIGAAWLLLPLASAMEPPGDIFICSLITGATIGLHGKKLVKAGRHVAVSAFGGGANCGLLTFAGMSIPDTSQPSKSVVRNDSSNQSSSP
jgi:hypothetical protein